MAVLRFAIVGLLCVEITCFVSTGKAQDSSDVSGQLSFDQTTLFAELMERDWENRPPWAEMAVMILKGDSMGTGQGWFTPAQRRHTWQWLVDRFPEAAADETMTAEELPQLSEADFNRVDRDHDGSITERDFQFDKNPLLEDDSPAGSIFSRLDQDSNGRLTLNELEGWFERSTGDSEYLSVEDLKDALGFAPRPRQPRSDADPSPKDPRWEMLGMFLDGEMGSFSEGPALDDEAPEIDLPLVTTKEHEGGLELTDRMIKLEDLRGTKPVVLIFGSFT